MCFFFGFLLAKITDFFNFKKSSDFSIGFEHVAKLVKES